MCSMSTKLIISDSFILVRKKSSEWRYNDCFENLDLSAVLNHHWWLFVKTILLCQCTDDKKRKKNWSKRKICLRFDLKHGRRQNIIILNVVLWFTALDSLSVRGTVTTIHNCTIFPCSLDVGNMTNAVVPVSRRKII